MANRKPLQRIYREERLAARRRRLRGSARSGVRAPIGVSDRPNARWSLDFVHDRMTDGRRLRGQDDCTRECLALVAETSLSGARVVRELEPMVGWRGRPEPIVSDNGTELTSTAILGWAKERRVAWVFVVKADRPRLPVV